MATEQNVPFRFPRLTPTVRVLLITLAAAFVVLAVTQNVAGVNLFGVLALDLTFDQGYVSLAWQPLTYWLVYPPIVDSLFNYALLLLGIYFFLAPFEERFGGRRALELGAAGILASALATIALAFVFRPAHPIAGPSPIVIAALGAFPVVMGNREILFMFVIPMKAWTVIALGLGVAALAAVLARDPFVFADHAAALGAGIGFAKWITRPRTPAKKPPARRRSGPDLKVVRGGEDGERTRWLN